MPDRENGLKGFYRLLRQRQISGEAARVQIADRLAKLTLDELMRVPPWVIVRLGPKGLALLAERSALIRVRNGGSAQINEEAGPAAVTSKRPPKLSLFSHLKRRRPLWWECLCKMALTATMGLALIVAFPFIQRGLQTLQAPTPTSGTCTQLDRWTGSCTYLVGSSGLSLSEVADRLALPLAALAAANPHLDPGRPLLPGTLIAVPRRAGINLR